MNIASKIKVLLFTNKDNGQAIFKNTFWIFATYFVARSLKFLLVIIAARVLGVSDYGSFSFGLSLVGMVFLFSDFGIGIILMREYARDSVEKSVLIANCFWVKIALIVLSVLIAFGM